MAIVTALVIALASGSAPDRDPGRDPDRDNDGLSDFHETHKYFTDPDRADSDGDGVSDGDWVERREFTYSIRTVVRVMPPVTEAALDNDYQDGRVIGEGADFVELEIVHYPFNTVAEAIVENPRWRDEYAGMREYLRPGLTTNWDAELQADLRKALAADGIDLDRLTDREAVERVSRWLMRRVDRLNSSSYSILFREGSPRLIPGTEDGFRSIMWKKGGTIAEQFQYELYGKGMYDNRVTGSCTSAANYLATGLRAAGIPTRQVRAVPMVDASDPAQVEMARAGITHHRARRTIMSALGSLGRSFAAHTYNEVYVGDRWRRLNYDQLGANILGGGMGLMTHVHMYNDLAEAGIADTWGVWEFGDRRDPPFRYRNPYAAVEVSDLFGPHTKLANPSLETMHLTVTRLYWYHSDERPERVRMNLDAPEGSGHLLVHVTGDMGSASAFYDAVDKSFVLVAPGQSYLELEAERGYWIDSSTGLFDFYLRLPPGARARMVAGVRYELHARNTGDGFAWRIEPGVGIDGEAGAAPAAAVRREHAHLTLLRVYWAESDAAPDFVRSAGLGERVALAHVGEWFPEEPDGDQIKRFTERADGAFVLRTGEGPDIQATIRAGSISATDGSLREVALYISDADFPKMIPGAVYTLHPRNGTPEHRWIVADGATLRR